MTASQIVAEFHPDHVRVPWGKRRINSPFHGRAKLLPKTNDTVSIECGCGAVLEVTGMALAAAEARHGS